MIGLQYKEYTYIFENGVLSKLVERMSEGGFFSETTLNQMSSFVVEEGYVVKMLHPFFFVEDLSYDSVQELCQKVKHYLALQEIKEQS